MKSVALPKNLAGMKKPEAKMVFTMLLLANCPNAVSVPKMALSMPLSPVVSLADPGANGFHPPSSKTLARPVACADGDDGDANVCSALGIAEIICDSVLCWVPAGVPPAWVTAADWAVSPPGLVVC